MKTEEDVNQGQGQGQQGQQQQQQGGGQQQGQQQQAPPIDDDGGGFGRSSDAGGDDWVMGDDDDDQGQGGGGGQGQQGQGQQQQGDGQQRQQYRQQFQQRGQGQGQGAGQGGGDQSGQGFEVRSQYGQVFRGNSAEEVAQQVMQYLDRAVTANLQLRNSGNGYQRNQDQQGAGQQRGQGRNRQSEPDDEFKADTFFTLLKDGKVKEATEYQLRHYFGVDNPREAFHEAYDISLKTRDRLETADFLASTPDFPNTDAASLILLQRLDQEGVKLTKWNLQVAFNQLVNEGVLSRVVPRRRGQQQNDQYDRSQGNVNGQGQDQGQGYGQQQFDQGFQGRQQQGQFQQQGQGQGQGRRMRAPAGPPNRGQGAETLGDRELSQAEFETLSTPDMKKYLRRRGYSV